MNLQELESLLIDAQRGIERAGMTTKYFDAPRQAIIAAKLMVQAEMARIGRIRAGELQDGDERRAGE